jgi:hypothetical protein
MPGLVSWKGSFRMPSHRQDSSRAAAHVEYSVLAGSSPLGQQMALDGADQERLQQKQCDHASLIIVRQL